MEKEEGGSSGSDSGSLTDLSSLSDVEGVPSHRRYSSTSYILNKQTKITPTSLATQLENPGIDDTGEHPNKQLPSHSGKDIESTQLPLPDSRERESMSSLDETHSTEETSNPLHNQTNSLSKSTRPEILVTPSVGSVESSTHRCGEDGHLFTEEEVKSLQQQIADMQMDIEQLLQYSQMVVRENNALKKILKDAVIIGDDQSMRQFCETLLVSVHEQPLLRSGVDYDHLASLQIPHHSLTGSQQASAPKLVPSSTTEWEHSGNGTALSLQLTPPLSHGLEQLSSSHRALEVSVESQKVTLFKTPPLDPQTTSIKGTMKPLESEASSSQQAAASIRKLYDLTFTDSQKAKNEKVAAAGEEREEEESRNDEEAATAGSGPFLSLRKSFKISPRGTRHGESKKEVSKSEKSPDLPHYGSNPLTRRKTVGGHKIERPKFYLRDILPVLQEKNKLKEQIHQLEYEVESLKSECGRLRVSHNTWLNRHSWAGMLVDTPEEVQTLSESLPPDGRDRSITMRLQPAMCDKSPYFTDAVAMEYGQRGLHKVYSLQVTRSDGQRFEIYRRYGEFFSFHHTLVQLFPAEAGSFDLKQKVLPSLPSIENVLMKSHLKSINRYCQTLLTKLDNSISRSLFVTNFFTPTQKDKQLPRLTKPVTKSELDASDNFQTSVPTASPTEEEYVILANYTTEMEGELNVSAGEVVQLINRDTTGWWLVSARVKDGEAKKVGRVPGDFLKRYDSVDNQEPTDDVNIDDGGKVSFDAILGGIADSSMLYVAAETYQTQETQQISFEEGTPFVVIEICEDGWWLAMTDGKEGWIPASYLSPGTKVDANISFDWTTPGGKTTGLKYITMAAFEAQHKADVSFPECAVVDVICQSLVGWWQIRYDDCVGLAPASLLALTDFDSALDADISEEEKMALSIDLSHSISGYVNPPPRSQKYLTSLGTTIVSAGE